MSQYWVVLGIEQQQGNVVRAREGWHTIRWACPTAPGIPHQGCIYMPRQKPTWLGTRARAFVDLRVERLREYPRQRSLLRQSRGSVSGDNLADIDLLQCLKVLR